MIPSKILALGTSLGLNRAVLVELLEKFGPVLLRILLDMLSKGQNVEFKSVDEAKRAVDPLMNDFYTALYYQNQAKVLNASGDSTNSVTE